MPSKINENDESFNNEDTETDNEDTSYTDKTRERRKISRQTMKRKRNLSRGSIEKNI